MFKTLLTITIFAASTLSAGESYVPSSAERARWTMQDMNSWRIVLSAYKQDNGRYPAAATLEELRSAVEPIYIKHAPMRDAWGNAYRYEGTAESYRVISSGADGKFDPATWSTSGKLDDFNADAVASSEGRWLARHWTFQ